MFNIVDSFKSLKKMLKSADWKLYSKNIRLVRGIFKEDHILDRGVLCTSDAHPG